jgi:hypothetical protein
MTMKTYTLMAWVNTKNPRAIDRALKELASKGSIIAADKGFFVKAKLRGEGARELNRTLLSALRRVGRKTTVRTEWTSGATTERFFDYVPKGSRRA